MNDSASGTEAAFPPFQGLPAGAIRILQVTDPHLYADPDNRLVGLKTQESLDLVLELARKRVLPVDLILVTGDLVHDSTPAGYQRLRGSIATLGAPAYCLPGNHDNSEVMAKWFNYGAISTQCCVPQGDWTLVMLDSTIPNSPMSHLPESELDRLAACLDTSRDKHILVCLHHQPVPVGSAWMDTMLVDNAEAFFAIVDRHPNVRGILFGHIHQIFEGERNGVKLFGSPSTCIQFTPGKDDFGLDPIPPGFRWLVLLPDGGIRSGVERLATIPDGLDFNSWGYV
jgi:3',5'-cyclic-AMP phosphodiesterase